jgi:ABC-type transport system substrate-binding protein
MRRNVVAPGWGPLRGTNGPRRLTAIAVAALLLAGCGSSVTPSPTASPSSSPTATLVQTAAPTPALADTLRIGGTTDPNANGMWLGGMRRTSGPGTVGLYEVAGFTLGNMVYSGLYRYDARFDAIPDLADGPCFVPGGDLTVIRCHILATTFHDGTPLTADDVAYSYDLFNQAPFENLIGDLKQVRIADARTLDFVLTSVDPTFLTSVLPAVPILPRHAIETAYATFVTVTKDLKAADLAKLADAIDAEATRDPPVCSPRLDTAAALLQRIGVHLYREDFTRSGAFDPCSYIQAASGYIRAAAIALGSTGLDAVAAAYQLLSTDERPIGAGPYEFVSEDAGRVHLEAFPGYHGGLAATRFLDFVPTKGDGSDVADGKVDVFQGANLGPAYQATAASRGVRVATPPTGTYEALEFNLRPGHLFADLNLRKALQLCIDLPRDVAAATGGAATPVYGPILPGTWAEDPNLPRPPRDTAAARRLIEGSGWTAGADGIYVKDGVPLAAVIPVRGDNPRRVKMADLVANQARECGMDLHSRAVPKNTFFEVFTYPHDIPGTKTPFDLLLGAWIGVQAEPWILGPYLSSHITDGKNPSDENLIGFSDPAVDRLINAAMSTYDQAKRAGYYRQVQEELAAQLPNIFLFAYNSYDLVRAAVSTVDGPLDLTALYWPAQPERLVVTAAGP